MKHLLSSGLSTCLKQNDKHLLNQNRSRTRPDHYGGSNPSASLPSLPQLPRRKAVDSRGLESELREIDARIAYVKARDHLLAVLEARRAELQAQIDAAPREVLDECAEWMAAASEEGA